MLDLFKPTAKAQTATTEGFFAAANQPEIRRLTAWLGAQFKRAARERFSENFTITPAMAEYILKNFNRKNRPLKQRQIRVWAAVMKAGNWRHTHQGLAFASTERLIDGQNRLHGVVISGCPVTFSIGFGYDESDFDVLDCGAPRTGADTLANAGYKNRTTLAATARLLGAINGQFHISEKVSNTMIIEIVEANPDLSDAVLIGLRAHGHLKCPPTPFAVAAHLIKTESPNAARLDEFVERVLNDPGTGSLLKLRDGLMKGDFRSKVTKTTGSAGIVECGSIIKCWNGWVTGARKTHINFDISQDFPPVE